MCTYYRLYAGIDSCRADGKFYCFTLKTQILIHNNCTKCVFFLWVCVFAFGPIVIKPSLSLKSEGSVLVCRHWACEFPSVGQRLALVCWAVVCCGVSSPRWEPEKKPNAPGLLPDADKSLDN